MTHPLSMWRVENGPEQHNGSRHIPEWLWLMGTLTITVVGAAVCYFRLTREDGVSKWVS